MSLFYSYWLNFLHPFQVQEFFWKIRTSQPRRLYLAHELAVPAQDDSLFHGRTKIEEVDLPMALSFSWIFAMIKAIYSLIGLTMGFFVFDSVWKSDRFSLFEDFNTEFTTQKIFLILILLEAVFFPISVWVYAKVWNLLIKFFSSLFRIEGNVAVISNQIVNSSLSSHVFFIVPVIGRVGQILASLVYIFAGLKNNLRMSNLQAVTVLISPVLVLLMFFFFAVVSMLMFINII